MNVIGQVVPQHVLRDIGVVVPYGVSVRISPEAAAKSRDLADALRRGAVFRDPTVPPEVPRSLVSSRVGSMVSPLAVEPVTTPPTPAVDVSAIRDLQAEVAGLRQLLERLVNSGLPYSVPPTQAPVPSEAPASLAGVMDMVPASTPSESDVIEIETPRFVPLDTALGSDASITPQSNVSSADSVDAAQEALAQQRRRGRKKPG